MKRAQVKASSTGKLNFADKQNNNPDEIIAK